MGAKWELDEGNDKGKRKEKEKGLPAGNMLDLV